jgi:hypothetical protein
MFKLPEFPAVDFSKFDLESLPKFDLESFRKFEVPTAVRDAAYLTIGVGATAFEQAQARARELANAFSDGLDATKVHVDTIVDKIEAILPDKVALVFGQAREISDAARNQVMGLIRSAA